MFIFECVEILLGDFIVLDVEIDYFGDFGIWGVWCGFVDFKQKVVCIDGVYGGFL